MNKQPSQIKLFKQPKDNEIEITTSGELLSAVCSYIHLTDSFILNIISLAPNFPGCYSIQASVPCHLHAPINAFTAQDLTIPPQLRPALPEASWADLIKFNPEIGF